MNTAELHRLLHNLLRIGVIESVDTSTKQCRVQIGDLLTGWLDMPADIGRNYKRWRPLRIGTQVLLACPGGDISAGIIIAMLFSNQQTAPDDNEAIDLIAFDDGTSLQYDSAAHRLTIDCVGAVDISCTDAGVTASGDASVTASGDASLIVNGNVDVIADGSVTVAGATVTLQDGSAGGVVCQSHVCAFTGSPHPQASSTITGGN